MIVANGVPKSGTHCVMAWLHSMGLQRVPGLIDGRNRKRRLRYYAPEFAGEVVSLAELREMPDTAFVHGHVHAAHKLDGFRVVNIFRDPRNVLVSYVRHQERVHSQRITVVDAINSFCGAPFVEAYRSFLGWRGRALCLRYEDFPPGFAGTGARLYAHAKHDHNTLTDSPSDWRGWWNRDIEHAWIAAGGPALLQEADYA